jgi:hypothetical protein
MELIMQISQWLEIIIENNFLKRKRSWNETTDYVNGIGRQDIECYNMTLKKGEFGNEGEFLKWK